MDIVDRCQRILCLLRSLGGSIRGRKKLQKIVYLLQAAGVEFGQEYVFWHYGVFSKTLASDLSFLVQSGDVAETLQQEGEYEYFEVSLAASEITNGCDELEKTDLIRKLADKKPRCLELLSTIVYLHRKGFSGEDVKCRLHELKEHLLDDASEAFDIARSDFSIEVES
jgi:hypothetical protein